MTFHKGVSGNPAGREPGSRNQRTIAAEQKLLARADELVDDLVRRALAGEPAAMRLCAERVLPVRGRPLPIDLPPIRHLDHAQKAAQVIVTALKEGALSAREAVDLLRVVEGLTRLTGTVGICKKIARREVARAAQTLGFEHFFAGPPAEHWKKKDTARIEAEALARWEHGDDADADADDADAAAAETSENVQTDGPDLSPDQRLGLQRLADSTENGGRPLPVRVDVGAASRCGAAGEGAALVNINENTNAALDGDADAHGREAANSLQLF
jgi:hypothetical protein